MTDAAAQTPGAEPAHGAAGSVAFAALAIVVAIGDALVWGVDPGAGVFVLFMALIVATLLLHRDRLHEPRIILLLAAAILGALPILESFNPLSLLSALAGLTFLALGLARRLPPFEEWTEAVVRFCVLAPFRLPADGLRALAQGGQARSRGAVWRGAVAWVVPLGFAVLFAWLFATANPLIDVAVRAIRLEAVLSALDPARVVLWAALAVLAWPFLVPRLMPRPALPTIEGPFLPKPEGLLFGRAAIVNSLLLFNALFALQTVMDLLYLWGGLRLPDGMSHAEYAHRGAYPLVVTAILAGAFVLAAMRGNGPGERSPLIRNLVYLWIAQNVWLVISSLLRLKLYVEAYHLSELRVAAAIWMGLVALGLVLIVVRIARRKSNHWLVTANLLALTLTVWGVAWLDLPGMIATYNVRHAAETGGGGEPLDAYYIGQLGPAAIPALDELLVTARGLAPEAARTYALMRNEAAAAVVPRDPADGEARSHDWRSWSWRSDRLERYVLDHPFAPDAAAAIE